MSPFSIRLTSTSRIRSSFLKNSIKNNDLHNIEGASSEDDEYDITPNNMTYDEIKQLEKAILEQKYGIPPSPPPSPISPTKDNITASTTTTTNPVPLSRECELYKWEQDEDWIYITIPLPRKAIRDDIIVIVEEESLSIKIKTCPELGVIGGDLYVSTTL